MAVTGRDDAEQVLVAEAVKLGQNWLRERLSEKLRAAGIEPKATLVDALVAQITKSDASDFDLSIEGDGQFPDDLTLEFTDADLADLDATIERFKAVIPKLITELSSKEAERLFKALKAKWPNERTQQVNERSEFLSRLEGRWGEGLGLLRMLLTVALEIGGERLAYDARRKKDRHLRQVLSRLHARACQITGEIIVLLENGFADGAMARWRTLHEISIVATVIAEGGDELAERYIEHQKVESKRASEDYERCHADLGYRPISKASAKRILKAHDAVVGRFGPDFAKPYGWATPHLRSKHRLKPKEHATFTSLQDAANRGLMQSHFRMASHNVHAGPQGIYFKLGQMGYSEVLLAGASNAGLVEPAQNAGLSLAQITALLFSPHPTIYDLIGMKTFARISQAIPSAFARADRQLRRDHESFLHGDGKE